MTGNGGALGLMEHSGAVHEGELKLVGSEMAGMAHIATPRGPLRIPLRECSNEQGDGVGKESAESKKMVKGHWKRLARMHGSEVHNLGRSEQGGQTDEEKKMSRGVHDTTTTENDERQNCKKWK